MTLDPASDSNSNSGDRPRPRPGHPPGRVQSGPFLVRCPPGRYALCRCRLSAEFPYCDGSHRGTEHRPIKIDLDHEQHVAWCACTRSGNPPFCDGSHADTLR